MTWTSEDQRLLLDLLRLDTTTPLESGLSGQLPVAQRRYAAALTPLGFRRVHFGPAPCSALDDPLVPEPVRAAAARMGASFLAMQPNQVLACGRASPERTIMFNFHMDTVSGEVPVRQQGGVIWGRGAVDDKGPGVALAAGLRDALLRQPDLPERIAIIVQSVAGEEGGAMGVYGTRVLAQAPYLGRLNLVAEPTGSAYASRSTASMTLEIRVEGRGSVDDEPEAGENATLILGYLAAWYARRVLPAVHEAGGTACLAGLHTGTAHNRVYGTGSLLVNFGYPNSRTAAVAETIVSDETAAALAEFSATFAGHPVTARTAASAGGIVRLAWLKRGLPTLDNTDPGLESLLRSAGFRAAEDRQAAPSDPPWRPFTCDAIWLGQPGRYTVVCGPGELGRDGAHGPGEHVAVADLAQYARRVSALVRGFASWCAPARAGMSRLVGSATAEADRHE